MGGVGLLRKMVESFAQLRWRYWLERYFLACVACWFVLAVSIKVGGDWASYCISLIMPLSLADQPLIGFIFLGMLLGAMSLSSSVLLYRLAAKVLPWPLTEQTPTSKNDMDYSGIDA